MKMMKQIGNGGPRSVQNKARNGQQSQILYTDSPMMQLEKTTNIQNYNNRRAVVNKP